MYNDNVYERHFRGEQNIPVNDNLLIKALGLLTRLTPIIASAQSIKSPARRQSAAALALGEPCLPSTLTWSSRRVTPLRGATTGAKSARILLMVCTLES